MSTEDLPPEEDYGITEADRRKMGELLQRRSAHGKAVKTAKDGLDGNAVQTALDVCHESYSPAGLLVTAWLFESGPKTAREAADATGVSYQTAREALNQLVADRLAHTNSERTFEGRGRDPTVYVPAPDGVPEYYPDP